jgi:hypothetical protein
MVRRNENAKIISRYNCKPIHNSILAFHSIDSRVRKLDKKHWFELIHRRWNTLFHPLFLDIWVYADSNPFKSFKNYSQIIVRFLRDFRIKKMICIMM